MSKLGKILYVLAGLSILSFTVIRFLLGAWVPFLWVALGLFALFLGASWWIDQKFYREFLTMRTTRQGMSMGALIAIMLVGLLAVNYLGAKHYKTMDWSLGKVNSLSDQSLKLLGSLTDELRVYYFYKNGTEGVEQNRHSFTDMIRRYQDHSSRIKLEFVELNERPDLAEKFEVKQATQVVWLEYKSRKARVEKIEEQEITSGLMKVVREKDKTVYFLSGHGELPFEAKQDGSSISLLKQLLESNRYQVKNFNFLSTASVPADADMVYIVGPSMTLLDPEVKAIEAYLKSGGNVVMALEPQVKTGLEKILSTVGLKMQNQLVATVLETPIGKAVDPRFARGSEFSSTHVIVKPFGKDQFTLFHLPVGLERTAPPPKDLSIDDLIKTNSSVMGFANTKFDTEGTKGPFVLANTVVGPYPGTAAAEKNAEKKDFNLIVFGDAEWLNDQYLYQNLNRDLALNMSAFLSHEENLISITPREVGVTQMEMSQMGFTLLIFGFVIPLPVLMFVGSGVLWYRRRYA